MIGEDIDIVFGILADDQVSIQVEFISGTSELTEATCDLDSSARVFFGFFPARDNDAIDAVTLQLPDRDGMIRPHPH